MDLFFRGWVNIAYAADPIAEASARAREVAEHGSEGLSIHLAPEVLGYLFGIPLTNTLLTTWVVMVLLIGFVMLFRRKLALVPGGVQVVIESLIGGAYGYVKDVLESEEYTRRFFPLIITIFIFILALNWIGLLPGVDAIGVFHEGGKFVPFLHPANTDLNITLGFTVVAFVTIEIAGIVLLGFLKYGSKFVNFRSPMAFAIGIIELFSELARLISFSFRLFGNVFAGKTLLLVAIFFVPFVVPVPLLAFEIFVGFIQAFIFAALTLFFIKLAVTPVDEH